MMNGVINVYKPCGITSFDVVREIKIIANTKKVGHTGTLDPEASGVLPICIGKATKIVDYIMENDKIYKAVLKLGIETDTYDREGTIINSTPVDVTENQVISAINSFIGVLDQVPPMYSALKVNGKRLYELARQGIEIERQSRKITIYSIEILDIELPHITFIIKCSKGTYIRSLCHDIGRVLNCGGTMWALERLGTGKFNIHNSIILSNINASNIEDYIIPIEDVLSHYESITLDKSYAKLIMNGVKIRDKSLLRGIDVNKTYRVFIEDEGFIGIGKRDIEGFKMIKLLL